MKKLIIYTFLVLIFSSCGSDFLDKEPSIVSTTEVALSTPEGLEGAVFALYDFPREALRDRVYAYYFVAGTELVKAGGLLTEDPGMSFYNSSLNPTHAPGEAYWNASYRALNHANTIIGRADEVGFTDENKKNRLLAEARFFRAYILFYLEQRFENIPLVTEESTTPKNDFEPAGRTEIYNVITEDLKFAVDNLEPSYSEAGRITKGAAQHLLAKVYLVLQNWTGAAAMAKAVIDSEQYRLLEDRNDLWKDHGQDNEEAIYVIQFAQNPGDEAGHQLAQQFQPLYDRIVGVKRSYEQGGRPWARYYPSDYLLGLFSPEDKRLQTDYKTVWIYDDEENLPRTFETTTGETVTVDVGDTVRADHVSDVLQYGPACKKFWEYGGHGRALAEVESRKSIIRFRLAETYLIAAEALWRADNEGNLEDALEMINTVRKRAGVDDYETLTEDMILEELARELAFEQHYWFDLKRMGKLVSRVKELSPDKDITGITAHHVRMPIPQSFRDATPGYPQNEGYD